MKKILLSSLFLAVSLAAMAVPAKRGNWRTITLDNGTQLRVELRGDEYCSYWRSEDGRFFINASEGKGFKQVAESELAKISLESRTAGLQAESATGGPRRVSLGTDHQPFEGTKKCLCVLVQFQDSKFKEGHTLDLFKQIINEVGFEDPNGKHASSVRDFFLAQSYGKFDMDFDVVGPVTVAHDVAYYGAHSGSANDSRVSEMIREAVDLANPSVDFRDYDWDGDGTCEPIFFLYAGMGEADGGAPETIWPHASAINKRVDNVYVTNYACGSELNGSGEIDGIGTMCHEYSHCLGLPDTYDVDYQCDTYDNYWDIMSAGCYDGGGYKPCCYNAYQRMYCGWITPQELPAEGRIEGLKDLNESGEAYIIRNSGYDNEYYLIEARTKNGLDAGLYGQGMLIWYVDFDKNVWSYNIVNCTSRYGMNDHNRMTLMLADNSTALTAAGIAADAFPTAKNNQFTDFGSPASAWYHKDADGDKLASLPIVNITKNAVDGSVSFDVLSQMPEGNRPEGAVFYESWDKNFNIGNVGGNDNAFSKKNEIEAISDNANWDYTQLWGGNRCGIVGSGSNKAGEEYIVTPAITLEAGVNYQFSFRIAPYGLKTDAAEIEVFSGNCTLTDNTCSLTRSKWAKYNTIITGSGRVKLKISRPYSFYLDEVLVIPASISGIESPVTKQSDNDAIYNLAGQRVDANYRGIIIRNGKKVLNK